MSSASSPAALRRDLRLVDAVAIGLGAIIGAGLFVVTGVAARVAGPAFLVGLVLAGLAATCNALSAAQLAALYPQSGGTYEYGYRRLGPAYGFAAGWLFLASKLAAGGTVALGFGAALADLIPGASARGVAVGAAAALTAANHFGIRKVGRLNVAIVMVTAGALGLFVVCGLPAVRPRNLTPFAPGGVGGVLEAAALLFFAYTGYARVATLGEEVRDPQRTIPRAIVVALAIASFLYLAVGFVAVGTIGAEAMGASAAPLQRAAEAVPLRGMKTVMGIGAATAMLGVLLSQLLAISRMAFAMARRGDLPRALGHVGRRHGVPDVALLGAGALIVLLVVFGTLEGVIAAASFTILVYYAITNLAALRLAAAERRYPRSIAAVGLTICVVLAGSLRPATIVAGAALLGVGFVVRAAVRRGG